MRARMLHVSASSAALVVGLLVVEACSTFDAAEDRAGDGGDAAGGAEASTCPPLQPFCEGAVEVMCPGLPDRCFSFCPKRATHEIAAGICAAWGGCLAGISTPNHLACLRRVTDERSAQTFVDLVQQAGSTKSAEGWRSTCSGAPQPMLIPWSTNEPNDANDAGMETGKEQCAEILSGGALVDTPCLGQYEYVCERPR